MSTFVFLLKLSEKGAHEFRDLPKRIETALSEFEGMGGKVIGVYAVLGRYDFILLGDMPSDGNALGFSAMLSSRGYFRAETLRAFPIEEFAGVVGALPSQ